MGDVEVYRFVDGNLVGSDKPIPLAELNPEKRFVPAVEYEMLEERVARLVKIESEARDVLEAKRGSRAFEACLAALRAALEK